MGRIGRDSVWFWLSSIVRTTVLLCEVVRRFSRGFRRCGEGIVIAQAAGFFLGGWDLC